MGRLRTIGWETRGLGRNVFGVDGPFFEGYVPAGVTAPSIDSTVARSGSASLHPTVDGVTNDYINVDLSSTEAPSGSTWIYVRIYVKVDQFPTGTGGVQIIVLEDSAGFARSTWTLAPSAGNWVFQADLGGPTASSAPLNLGQWYRLEIGFQANNGVGASGEARVDGTTLISSTILTSTANSLNSVLVGAFSYNAGYSGTAILHFDDMAINSSSGSTQNSWPGDGSIVQLLPVSDNARTGWAGGAGGTTNLWQAVSHTPPVGVAKASETNTSQIKDGASSATDNYDANLADYTTGGVPTAATVTLVQALISQGSESTTGTDSGSLQVVSNPVQSVADSFTFQKLSNTSGVSTWPDGWAGQWGTAQVGDVANRSTKPVLRIGKRTATTRADDCCYMGLMVEYVPQTVVASVDRRTLLGVGR
jgi:hypothetical protein